ncbi:hypothetical protein [Aeromonas sp. 600479]|uniref:hypothetical protein n=1 Tax=Aeromonas sp. 600479 TaxID=2712028 RepID=UPI003B9E90AD
MEIVFWVLVALFVIGYFANKKEATKKNKTANPHRPSNTSGPVFSKKGTSNSKLDLSHYSRADLMEIAFSYIDSKGDFSQREVSVSQVTNTHIKGWCHERKALRTFKTESIILDVTLLSSGEVVPVKDWVSAAKSKR